VGLRPHGRRSRHVGAESDIANFAARTTHYLTYQLLWRERLWSDQPGSRSYPTRQERDLAGAYLRPEKGEVKSAAEPAPAGSTTVFVDFTDSAGDGAQREGDFSLAGPGGERRRM
jgi:hypothetical protein